MPGYVLEPEPYRPEMLLWLELPDDLLVAGEVIDRNGPPIDAAQFLRRAFERPLAGAPRKPSRLRVADAAFAAELRATIRDIPIVVAPTPELDAALDSMAQHMPADADEESYLEDGRVSEAAVAQLFRASELIWRTSSSGAWRLEGRARRPGRAGGHSPDLVSKGPAFPSSETWARASACSSSPRWLDTRRSPGSLLRDNPKGRQSRGHGALTRVRARCGAAGVDATRGRPARLAGGLAGCLSKGLPSRPRRDAPPSIGARRRGDDGARHVARRVLPQAPRAVRAERSSRSVSPTTMNKMFEVLFTVPYEAHDDFEIQASASHAGPSPRCLATRLVPAAAVRSTRSAASQGTSNRRPRRTCTRPTSGSCSR